MMSRDIAQYTGDGKIPQKFGAYFPFTAPYGNFFASDGEFCIGIHDTEGFQKFCALAGLEEIAQDERFANSQDRLVNRDALYELLIAAFAERPVEEWLALADAVGGLSSRVNDVSDLIEQEQAIARELIVDIGIDNLKVAGIPIKLSRTPGQIRMAPHLPGEDTDAVLGELGFSTDEVQRLREDGVVA